MFHRFNIRVRLMYKRVNGFRFELFHCIKNIQITSKRAPFSLCRDTLGLIMVNRTVPSSPRDIYILISRTCNIFYMVQPPCRCNWGFWDRKIILDYPSGHKVITKGGRNTGVEPQWGKQKIKADSLFWCKKMLKFMHMGYLPNVKGEKHELWKTTHSIQKLCIQINL